MDLSLRINAVGDTTVREISAAAQKVLPSGVGRIQPQRVPAPDQTKNFSPTVRLAEMRSNLKERDALVKQSLDAITRYADGALYARIIAISAIWYKSSARLAMSDGSTIRCRG